MRVSIQPVDADDEPIGSPFLAELTHGTVIIEVFGERKAARLRDCEVVADGDVRNVVRLAAAVYGQDHVQVERDDSGKIIGFAVWP